MSASSLPPGRPAVVRIGCSPVPLQRLQSFLGAWHLEAPWLQPEVLHLATADQLERLRTGDLDLGVIDHADPAPPLHVEPLYEGESVATLLPPGHHLASRTTVGPGDLAGETWLRPPRAANPAFSDALDAAFAAAGHHVPRWSEVHGADPRDVLLAVAHGHGVAVSPLSTLKRAGELGELLVGRLLDPPVQAPGTMLAWRADPTGAPAEAIAAAGAVARALHAVSSYR